MKFIQITNLFIISALLLFISCKIKNKNQNSRINTLLIEVNNSTVINQTSSNKNITTLDENDLNIVCKYFQSKTNWEKSSHYCIDEAKISINSLDDCKETNIYKPFPFGKVWFYCYPLKDNLKIFFRIEIKSCLGYESIYMSWKNKYYDAIKKGIYYQKKCTRPVKSTETNATVFDYQTVCNGTPIKFNFKNYIEIKDHHLLCSKI